MNRMDRLDLTHVQDKVVYPLGEAFSGRNPDGKEIGFTNYYMTIDGKPFFGISGEMHYARVSPDQWEDTVVKMQCGGINILSTYAFWNVHEEEEGVFYEDRSNEIMTDENLARLMTFPNVLVTSHMGFFTREAMQAIAQVTLENAYALENGLPLVNRI